MIEGRVRSFAVVVLMAGVVGAGRGNRVAGADPPGTAAGVFELTNQQTGYIPVGHSRIVTASAFATHNNKQPPFGTEGVTIRLYPRPLTDADRADILTNNARGMKGDCAVMLLFLDKDRKIGQVNLTYVVPGTTVARTVASSADELSRSFANFHFDGTHLHLVSKGTFKDVNERKEPLVLSWDVTLDLPVAEEPKK